jgi:hypothetical protein
MKKLFLSYLIPSIIVGGICISCKKEKSCEGCKENNKPPTAIAGPDQVITLPTDSISLDGRSSSDPDGTISEWLWKKIEGPASFNIISASTAKTIVKNLTVGTYQFELKVTDDKGLTAKDTMQVVVNSVTPINRPPIANSGIDQTITLPTNTTLLDGSASTDPDNNITAYAWTKISGPSSFNIANASTVQTQVTNLAEGVYEFELKVTDAGGLFSKDTVQINILQTLSSSCEPYNRPVITAQLIPFGNLSIARTEIAAIAAGNKIFFAGGNNSTGSLSRVDIYDISSQSWSTAELSLPRAGIKAIACGSKVLFASGHTSGGGAPYTSRIDIYDLTTQSWSTAELPFVPVHYYLLKVAAVGNKALFGYTMTDQNGITATSVTVGIYDVSTQSWSTTTLSEPRMGFNALTAGDKVYFSGGAPDVNTLASKTIDIYDNSTGTWSTSLLAEPKADHGGVYKNGKIYWAGGSICGAWINADPVTCNVEIKDINTQTSTFSNLSQPTPFSFAFDVNGKLAFFGSGGPNNFDIYDVSTNSWAIGFVNQVPTYYMPSWVAANNAIFIAGGSNCPNSGGSDCYSSQVWKLVF